MKKALIAVIFILSGLIVEHEYGLLHNLKDYSKFDSTEDGIITLSDWNRGDYKKEVVNSSTMILQIPIYVVGEDTAYKKVTVKYLTDRRDSKNPLTPSTWYILEGN